ncbi:MAG: hypothetical protein OEL82_11615 [Nitrosopumilus sp.]|nr:hypothetical protein [Nitrosopumilus sp.]
MQIMNEMIEENNNDVEIISESYDESENIFAGKNLAAGKGDQTKNLEHTVQTA